MHFLTQIIASVEVHSHGVNAVYINIMLNLALYVTFWRSSNIEVHVTLKLKICKFTYNNPATCARLRHFTLFHSMTSKLKFVVKYRSHQALRFVDGIEVKTFIHFFVFALF